MHAAVFALIAAVSVFDCYAERYNRCTKTTSNQDDEHQPVSLALTQLITTFQRTTPSSDKLILLIAENPCFQILYSGPVEDFAISQQYALYGMCNINRMFRFTVRYNALMACWNMDLELWDRSRRAGCQQMPLADVYSMKWSLSSYSSVCVGPANCSDPFASESDMVYMNSLESGARYLSKTVRYSYGDLSNLTVENRTGCLCEKLEIDGGNHFGILASNETFETFWNDRCVHRSLSTLKSDLVKYGLGITILTVWVIALLTLYLQKRV